MIVVKDGGQIVEAALPAKPRYISVAANQSLFLVRDDFETKPSYFPKFD